ncbi:AAA family ATPase [Mycolicibacterium flavescens]|uniref:LuxR family transcriptional regulator n=1 Tax=Mycolicibacterium flavescens TaxID=1776 RepID=A0A1E3RLN5_MYCFV|nr:AAA family ATPase [Mycolicibacterium flavescens]MCV7281822.1 AAA family ATPase [Mycolicibacterium flavescens]ODQ90796.1 LuxR family transcriptional regulator [Mycolicibacterium flavescens]
MVKGVIERPAEFRAVAELLSCAERCPCALVIEGQAGVGKTTLWLEGVEAARERGFRVLSARAAQAETALAYATVADLLGDVDHEVIDGLPEVQRIAVDRVLLRADDAGPGTDQGVVAAAFTTALQRLIEDAPLLLALDDVQWLDPSSQAVVAFAARRLTGRVGLLLTERSEHEGEGAAGWLQLSTTDAAGRVHVGPLSLGGLHALVSARLGRTFPRPTMVRIAEISGGNPFYALELARAIEAGGSQSVLPATLAELMRQRIGRLEPETQVLLLAAASSAAPTLDLLARVTRNTPERTVELLDEAKTKGIITFEGDDVAFTHPLLARSVYTDASRRERRAMHRALAEEVDSPESRARHMAMAASSADATTLEALDEAAATAWTRGAPAAAAELLELAIGLGGDTPVRRIYAADQYLHAGDLPRAEKLLEGLTDRVARGVHRAMALNLLGAMRIHNNSFTQAVEMLEDALKNDGGDREVRVRTLLLLSYAQLNEGEFGKALQNVERAAAYAEDVGHNDLTAQVLAVRATIACMCGRGIDWPSVQRALVLQDPHSQAPIAFRPRANHALLLAWAGRLDEASQQMTVVRDRCVERGAETDLIFVAVFTALIEVWRGRYDEARRVATETVERAQQLGGEHMRVIAKVILSAVASYAGDEAQTREMAQRAIDLAHACGSPRLADWAAVSLGFLEVSMGRHEQAVQTLQPLIERFPFIPGTEIITVGYVPDAVEAMIALGRADDALQMIEALETNGRMVDRAWMLAIGARGRSMWLAAHGDVPAAVDMAQQALGHHEWLPMPFERARTLLLLGQLQRRQRQKDVARVTLTEALEVFESLGTPLWAKRARAELARLSTVSGGSLGLTASEQRVAELAATGMTTKDVAAALFISPKTVETNLSRIYRKLGIKTRAELGRVFGDGS